MFDAFAVLIALPSGLPGIAISISRWPEAAFLGLRPLAGCDVPPLSTSLRLLEIHSPPWNEHRRSCFPSTTI